MYSALAEGPSVICSTAGGADDPDASPIAGWIAAVAVSGSALVEEWGAIVVAVASSSLWVVGVVMIS